MGSCGVNRDAHSSCSKERVDGSGVNVSTTVGDQGPCDAADIRLSAQPPPETISRNANRAG